MGSPQGDSMFPKGGPLCRLSPSATGCAPGHQHPAPKMSRERFPMDSVDVQSAAAWSRAVLADFLPICCCLCGVGPTAKSSLILLLLGQCWTGMPKSADQVPSAYEEVDCNG